MAVNLFLLMLCVLETLQHLSYPINFCNMASTCLHDGRAVCASSPDGCSRKGFLDQCDMYEYNCDYGTQYSYIDCDTKCSCCDHITEETNSTSSKKDKKLFLETSPMDPPKENTKNGNGCRRPVTWETTARGETRDFFRVLT